MNNISSPGLQKAVNILCIIIGFLAMALYFVAYYMQYPEIMLALKPVPVVTCAIMIFVKSQDRFAILTGMLLSP